MAVPVMWRTQKQRYSLQAETCSHCSNAVFPPRAVCPYCKTPMRVQIVLTDVAQQQAPQGREFLYALPTPAIPVLVVATGDD